MKKFFLIVFILVDLCIIGASVLFLMVHFRGLRVPMMNAIPGMSRLPVSSTAPAHPTAGSTPAVVSTDSMRTSLPALPTPAGATVSTTSRKILFTYRKPSAKKVELRADFTGWRGEKMTKDATGVWKYMAVLEPGEYAYCYSVDDKAMRDPANKRTKTVGKTVVSAIVVQPPANPSTH